MLTNFFLKMWLRQYNLRERIRLFLFTIEGSFSLALWSMHFNRPLWQYYLLRPIAWVYGKMKHKFSGRRYKQETHEYEGFTTISGTSYLTKWGQFIKNRKDKRKAKIETMLEKCESEGLIHRFTTTIKM